MQICSYVFPLLKFASEINSSHATLIPVRESFKRNQSARNHINEIFGQQKASDRIMNFVSINHTGTIHTILAILAGTLRQPTVRVAFGLALRPTA